MLTTLLADLNWENTALKKDVLVAGSLEAQYQTLLKAKEDRIIIHQYAYNQMKTVNERLIRELGISLKINKKIRRKRKFKNFIIPDLSLEFCHEGLKPKNQALRSRRHSIAMVTSQ